ncbi:MAG: hypothetical protein KKB81_00905 [Candidatus Margulisbacteria bacterium]|nr:hypothetical protein [Candidatus Margulisiibacteriota bacterium]MBU1021537.1 hypothetical protein [Candidatus Margulisiibacteriota bacterium]MBU1728623.1 hypothetical protein [Candidatus Margulisiibacteriota bacterium]MBU1955074.1 hypothetical protein [Candidatus Margulisiibacteriota bacterium]
MKEIVGLVAVRTESTRLPNKAFRLLNGKPLLEVLIDRLAETPYLDDFVICTTQSSADDKIENFCKEKQVKCYRGEVKNVLGRFIGASAMVPSEYVVRITGDNPLSDFYNMHQCFEYLKSKKADYSRPEGVPLGTACEVILTKALHELDDKSLAHDLSEYMTYFFELAPFIKDDLYQVEDQYNFPDLRLTVDYEKDLLFIQEIVKHFNGKIPALSEIVSYCRSLPDYPKVKSDAAMEAEIKSKIIFK